MIQWDELVLDLVAIALIAVGVWLWFPPAGLIVAGLGLLLLSIGLKARRGNLAQGPYKAVEVDE